MNLLRKNVLLVVILGLVFIVKAQGYKELEGYVRNQQGVPLCSAVVILISQNVYTLSDVNGYYSFSDGGDTIITEISQKFSTPSYSQFKISNGIISFSLLKNELVKIELYDLKGRLITNILNKRLSAGNHTIPFQKNILANELFIVRANFGSQISTFKYMPFITSGFRSYQSSPTPITVADKRQVDDALRVSSPGYKTKVELIKTYVDPVDFALDSLISQTGTHVVLDGTMDRLTIWGKTTYYWGDIGLANDVPLVKIIHARSHRVLDAAIIFNPVFVDLTYGDNAVGWNKHSFESLVKSDHVEVALVDSDSTTVFQAKIDLLSVTDLVTSGYASLGVEGGDGQMMVGSASDVYSWGTSFDDNINFYGYHLFESSPATDTAFTMNPDYPYWEYYVVYHICVNSRVFGAKAFDDVFMSFVHASPSKNGPDTVPVTKKIQIGQNDPFIHVQTFTLPDIQ